MSVIFQAVILPHQRKKDGTNVIRIRVTHNKESKWIKTNIVLSAKEQTRDGKPKSKAVMKPAEELIERMTEVVNSIDMYKLQKMDVEQLVKYINVALEEPDRFTLDFIEYGRKVAEKKRGRGTRQCYLVTMNALERFFKGRHPDISEITVRKLREFEQFLNEEKTIRVNWRTGEVIETKKPKGNRAISLYMSALRHIYHNARLDHNDPDLNLFPIPNDPFEYYSVPREPAPRHRDLPIEVIQLMIDTRERYDGRTRVALDAFLISFGLFGMNAIDLFTCAKPKKDVITYHRTKTKNRRDDKAEMLVRVEPCIQKIMAGYEGKDRCFDFYKRFSSIDSFSASLNTGLKRWAEDHKLSKFTFYSARHSWATIGAGKKCKIAWEIISAGLCHVNQGSRKVDAIYINQDWELIWDANRKILELFDWK